MLVEYTRRGLKAGLVGGIVYGCFVALIGNPLISFIETMGQDLGHGHGHVPTHAPVFSGALTNVVSIGAGIALGLLFGAVIFGGVYYFLEPGIPGKRDTKSYLLGGVGFVTVSGAPWLLLPPQPPGIEQAQALPTDVRIIWYGIMMAVGAIACGLSGYAYVRLRGQRRRIVMLVGSVVPLFLIPVVAVLGGASLGVGAGIGTEAGPLPESLVRSYQAIVIFGQIGLWMIIAGVHAWLIRRERRGTTQLEAASGDQEGLVWAE
jgi:predicted cobalt transporter CbtA